MVERAEAWPSRPAHWSFQEGASIRPTAISRRELGHRRSAVCRDPRDDRGNGVPAAVKGKRSGPGLEIDSVASRCRARRDPHEGRTRSGCLDAVGPLDAGVPDRRGFDTLFYVAPPPTGNGFQAPGIESASPANAGPGRCSTASRTVTPGYLPDPAQSGAPGPALQLRRNRADARASDRAGDPWVEEQSTARNTSPFPASSATR